MDDFQEMTINDLVRDRIVTADGGPYGDLDRVRRRHFTGVDDAHLWHIECPGNAAHHG